MSGRAPGPEAGWGMDGIEAVDVAESLNHLAKRAEVKPE